MLNNSIQREVLNFAQKLVQIQSYSGQEEKAIRAVEQQMKALGYDEVRIDQMGNICGRIGTGKKQLLFDAHIDTVTVNDTDDWDFDPFGGEISDGFLHGRGSVDMKSSVAAAVYAAAVAREKRWLEDKSIYVTVTVFEEDCDGENLKHLFHELNIRPDAVVICEPSNNMITLGHKGKIQFVIETHGISAHGSAPEKGLNAVYEMTEIIQRVENLNLSFDQNAEYRKTLVLSQISSTSASLNAVPSSCEIYLDRRIVPLESKDDIFKEIEKLIQGKKASWRLGTLDRVSWTGLSIKYEPFHLAWQIHLDHPLTQTCINAFDTYFGKKPSKFDFWDFSTNAVTPVSMGIPCIGFGPGDYKLAHMRNEKCATQQIIDACGFYTHLIRIF
jgi:putative selenium metabolism hydrolase